MRIEVQETNEVLEELRKVNSNLEELIKLDKMLLKAEAAAGMMDGFPIISALVDKEEETLVLK